MHETRRILMACCLVPLTISCSVWRGIPTHGGGKRFDEEQLAVANSVRQAVADMDLEEMKGKSIQIMVNSISQSGGGSFTAPGLQNISGSFGSFLSTGSTAYAESPPPPGYYGGAQDSTVRNDSRTFGYGFAYQPGMSYSSAAFGTEGDLTYLISTIEMRCREAGATIVMEKPECMVYVLVDVLGLNRSRKEGFILWEDSLVATCELTYYAIGASGHNSVFAPRLAKGSGAYEEKSAFLFAGYKIERKAKIETPDGLLPASKQQGEK